MREAMEEKIYIPLPIVTVAAHICQRFLNGEFEQFVTFISSFCKEYSIFTQLLVANRFQTCDHLHPPDPEQ